MFGEFLSIILKSIKLDKTLYSDSKNFGEASVYFAGIIMILDGIAGAVAANTVFKTAVALQVAPDFWLKSLAVSYLSLFRRHPLSPSPDDVPSSKGN